VTTPPNLPLRGAVDLSTFASKPAGAPASAGAGHPGAAKVVIDVTEASFQSDVIELSQRLPVIVDLWASWCGPCKTLSPILENLAVEYGGRFVLAKVDVDAEQAIAGAFQVQSIPSIFVVLGGQPAPLFQGALPEPQVRQYIDEVLKLAAQAGITGRVEVSPDESAGEPEEIEEVVDPRYAAAYAAIEDGDWAAAQAAYEAIVSAEPMNADAVAGVALCALQLRVESQTDVQNATTIDGVLTDADAAAVAGAWDRAFGVIIDAIRVNFGDDRERLRLRLLDLFAIAGDDEAVPPARVALANALF